MGPAHKSQTGVAPTSIDVRQEFRDEVLLVLRQGCQPVSPDKLGMCWAASMGHPIRVWYTSQLAGIRCGPGEAGGHQDGKQQAHVHFPLHGCKRGGESWEEKDQLSHYPLPMAGD